MARNKYPEETRQLILDVAQKLFLEKGFDGTTIKDIIAELGGLTKGVIYHHFESKEDILEQVLNRMADASENKIMHELDLEAGTGLEKLQCYLISAIKRFELISIVYATEMFYKSPRIIGERYLESFSYALPEITKMIEVGIEDGSIETEFPEEVAEVMIVLSNLWIAIQLPNWTSEEIKRKFLVSKRIFESLNVPIVTEQTLEAVNELCDYLNKLE